MIANIVPEILQWKNELNSETQNDTKCKIFASSQNCYLRLVFLTAIFCVVTLWFLVLSTEGFLLKYKVKYEVKYEVIDLIYGIDNGPAITGNNTMWKKCQH